MCNQKLVFFSTAVSKIELPEGTLRLCNFLHQEILKLDLKHSAFREPGRWYLDAERGGPASTLRCYRQLLRQICRKVDESIVAFDFMDRSTMVPTNAEATVDIDEVKSAHLRDSCSLSAIFQFLDESTQKPDLGLSVVDYGAIQMALEAQRTVAVGVFGCFDVDSERPSQLSDNSPSVHCEVEVDTVGMQLSGATLLSYHVSTSKNALQSIITPLGCTLKISRVPSTGDGGEFQWINEIYYSHSKSSSPSRPFFVAYGLLLIITCLFGFWFCSSQRSRRKLR